MREKSYKSLPHPRIGVAMSGGGARGLAHAGALAAIEEAGLQVDVISGVSAGSIAAVLYAAGNTPDQILDVFKDRSFKDFVDLRPHGGGLFSMTPFMRILAEHMRGYEKLEDLPTETYIGVTDFDHGVPAEFHAGDLLRVVLASCSIPIVFRPVEIDGVRYVDGGVLRNHPAWIIRDKCDILIGINVSPLKPVGNPESFYGVAMRTYNLMAKANQKVDMDICDISVVTPEIAGCSTFDLKFINNLYLSGYIHTRKALREAGLWHNRNHVQ